jgi:hypothetical protein
MTYLVPKGHYFGDSSHDLNIECRIRHSQSVNFLISYPGVINIHLHRFSRRARSQNIGAKECILRDRSSAGRSCEISHPRAHGCCSAHLAWCVGWCFIASLRSKHKHPPSGGVCTVCLPAVALLLLYADGNNSSGRHIRGRSIRHPSALTHFPPCFCIYRGPWMQSGAASFALNAPGRRVHITRCSF